MHRLPLCRKICEVLQLLHNVLQPFGNRSDSNSTSSLGTPSDVVLWDCIVGKKFHVQILQLFNFAVFVNFFIRFSFRHIEWRNVLMSISRMRKRKPIEIPNLYQIRTYYSFHYASLNSNASATLSFCKCRSWFPETNLAKTECFAIPLTQKYPPKGNNIHAPVQSNNRPYLTFNALQKNKISDY